MNERGVDPEVTKASFEHEMIYLNKKILFFWKETLTGHWTTVGGKMTKASQLECVDLADNDYRLSCV